ncbi:MAG: hypothetical protein Kow0056_14680 [Coriobacteriia bacterium]
MEQDRQSEDRVTNGPHSDVLRVALAETCRVVRGTIPLLPLHLERLAAGGCTPQLLERVRHRMSDTAATATGSEYARLRVVVETDGSIETTLDERPSALDVAGGPSFVTVPIIGAPPLPPGAAKPADRTPWEKPVQEARQEGADLGVLVDSDGNVVDATTATVWLAYADRVFTPPAPPAVAGVARRLILDRGREAGARPEVAHIRESDLWDADEVFFSSALGGVRCASGRRGPVGTALEEWFARVFEEGLDV